MDCTEAQNELIAYLYGENNDPRLRRHLADCPSCSREIADMATIKAVLSEIALPPSANRSSYRRRPRLISWAAMILFGFVCGWLASMLTTASNQISNEILRLLAHNQQYRDSLSHGQLLLIQQMEKRLGRTANLSEQIALLHRQENLAMQGKIDQCIQQQRLFLDNYRHSPLVESVCSRLAQNLTITGDYHQAAAYYQRLLLSPLLAPPQRGRYLWQLGLTYRHCRQWRQYYAVLGELENEKAYQLSHWHAVKALADADFIACRFIQARQRYQHYRQSGLADVGEVAQRLSWIDYHEQDNFYPLVLFVQAQQEGLEAFYGLRIILRQYPDSPLAPSAFQLISEQR